MRKFSIVLLIGILLISSVTAYASSDVGDIHSININVELLEYGDARVTEFWDAQMNRNTEIYKPMTNMGSMEIQNLTVTDSTGVTYETLPEWDVDADIDEKRHKAGLNYTDDGVEICWGIGDFERKTYTVSYEMTNLVKAYDDYDGFNSRFINSDMNPLPRETNVTISIPGRELTSGEVGMWAFGYDGDINLSNGAIVATSNQGIRSSREHMTIMLRLEKGIIKTTEHIVAPFSSLSDVAFRGSSYTDAEMNSSEPKKASPLSEPIEREKSSDISPLAAIFIALGSIGGVLGAFFGIRNATQKITDFSKPVNSKEIPGENLIQYNTTIPFEGYIPAIVYAMSGWMSANVGEILNAYLLKWAKDGLVKIDSNSQDLEGEDFQLYLSDYPTGISNEELKLYSILKSGERPEGYINKKAIEALIENDSVVWNGHFQNLIRIGKNYFKSKGYIKKDIVTGFLGKEKEVELYTDMGIQAMEKFYGFKKFLKDLPDKYGEGNRENIFHYDVDSWDEYAIYGGLVTGDSDYGIKLGESNSDYNTESGFGRGFGYGYPGYYPYYLFTSVNRVSSNVSSTMYGGSGGFSGGGGSASFGGGGGFSGGGGGGGSR